jgi:type IV secretion system protein VirB11
VEYVALNDILEPTESPAAPILRYLMQPLAPWLDDPVTEDIAIQKPGAAWVFARGRWTRHEVDLDLNALEEIAILAGALRHQDVGPEMPMIATELISGERFQGCLPPTVPMGTVAITIRKPERGAAPVSTVRQRYDVHNWNKWTAARRGGRGFDDLLKFYDDGDIEGFLNGIARARLNVLFVGMTGAGKTTLGKCLITAIPRTERVITIEDAEEFSGLPDNCVRHLFKRDGSGPGTDQLLNTASLRERPDRILLQELRGPEAYTFLHVSLANPGSISTLHGDSVREGLFRLFGLSKGHPEARGMQDDTVKRMIASVVDVVMPLASIDGRFHIGSTWFIGDAGRRNETAADLLEDA